jgi:hypothetical protein
VEGTRVQNQSVECGLSCHCLGLSPSMYWVGR